MPVNSQNKDAEALLKKGLDGLGFSYSDTQINSFMTYLYELKKWNKAYNLTALKTDRDIIIKHFLDSLLYLKVIQECSIEKETFMPQRDTKGDENNPPVPPLLKGGEGGLSCRFLKIADAGTGAGFPGIPMKIMKPELDMTLIESSMKKVSFLRHIVRTLKISGINILNSRIETLGENCKRSYDVIVSRAAFKIKDFIEKACPYVKEDGILVMSKGPGVFEEIKGLKDTGSKSIEKIIKLSLMNYERNLLLITCKNLPL